MNKKKMPLPRLLGLTFVMMRENLHELDAINAFADDVRRSLQVGFTEHLSKPLDSATLVSALQRARADAACHKPTPSVESD